MTAGMAPPRNIVVCFDGTSNTFGQTNTNVVRLVESLSRDPARQRIYYDPGVGTLPEPGYVTGFGKRFSEVVGLAFGGGLTWKVELAYQYLMEAWEPGDRIFLFGFSRGAYSARVLAAMLHAFGLLPRGNTNLVPHVLKLFKTVRRASEERPTNYWKLLNQFRRTFARDSGVRLKRVETHCLGVWDTVSSVGWVWNPLRFPFTAANPSVSHIRHAVSIDERRCFFRQNLFDAEKSHDLKEYWFAGSHGDVGGGYPEGTQAAWRVAFDWMVDEAVQLGLLVDAGQLQHVRDSSFVHDDHWQDEIHDQLSIQKAWWLAEFLPKLVYQPGHSSRSVELGLGRSRALRGGERIHRSALLRIRGTNYVPRNLSAGFLTEVRSLAEVPETLPYRP